MVCASCGHVEGLPTTTSTQLAGQRGKGPPPPPPRTPLPPRPTVKPQQAPNPGAASNASGTWVDAANRKAWTQFPSSVLRSPRHLEACQKLQQNLAAVEVPAFVTAGRFDSAQACWEWELPAGYLQFSARTGRMSSDDTAAITITLLESLKAFHAAGLSVIDFSPDQVLVHATRPELILIPSPWLCNGDFKGMALTVPRVIAPELAAGLPPRGEVRADLYGLGQLVFRLLTQRASAVQGVEFPSDVDPQFKAWDGFVDGCCRRSPERRFASFEEASQFLPGQRRQRTFRGPTGSPRSRKLSSKIAALVVFCILLGGWWGLSSAGVLPSLNPLGWFSPQTERGYADTVLQYRSRSYNGTKWQELSEIRALREVTNERLKFSHITGWNDENLSVTAYEYGQLVVFRYHAAHWEIFSRMGMQNNGLKQHFLSQDSLLLAGHTGNGKEGVYRITPVGTEQYGDLPGRRGDVTLTPLAADLCFVFDPNGGAKGAIRIIGNASEEIDITLHKGAFVHQNDNVPLKEFPIQNIIKTRSDRSGHAIGFCQPVGNARGKQHLLVEFRDGIWYKLAELIPATRPDREVIPRDLWYSTSGEGPFVVWVAESGNVFRYQFGKSVVEQQLPPTTELTSAKLILVWGASLADYHVMDTNGTIWHWDATQWQIAIRGLREKDVEFIDAWVSPEGTVFGITELKVLQLR